MAGFSVKDKDLAKLGKALLLLGGPSGFFNPSVPSKLLPFGTNLNMTRMGIPVGAIKKMSKDMKDKIFKLKDKLDIEITGKFPPKKLIDEFSGPLGSKEDITRKLFEAISKISESKRFSNIGKSERLN